MPTYVTYMSASLNLCGIISHTVFTSNLPSHGATYASLPSTMTRNSGLGMSSSISTVMPSPAMYLTSVTLTPFSLYSAGRASHSENSVRVMLSHASS